LSLTDILLCNRAEAVTLADDGSSEIETLASRLHQRGAPCVIITLGKNGAVVSDGNGMTRIPAFAVPVVDTTAAGDVFAGVLAARLAAGDALRLAARVASAAAALAVGRAGAQPSLPTAAQVEAFLVTH
jgi:ribokinase